ncbi:MAG TPA: undecaprenyl-diphosphate phosphatase [Firmicutes bacterium]|nr:undecaprenyl-diphosphate phosphatase [Bacillota bacterium]
MEFLEILKSFLMGIVEGITEWLPISSTGHLLLLDEFLHITVSDDPARSDAFFDMFKVVIQLGAILAVVVLYFHKLNPFSPKKSAPQKKETWSLWGKVLIGSIPAAIIGLLIDDIVDNVLSTWYVIAAALIVYGILFIWMENRRHTPRIERFDQLDIKTVLVIGVFQVLAMIPGTSRSGATILGATLMGTSRYIAAEFSFFLAIPVMIGASGLKMVKFGLEWGFGMTGLEWGVLLTGFLVSFVVSVLAIRFLMNFIKKHDFKPFGYYRIVLGILIILWFGIPLLIS